MRDPLSAKFPDTRLRNPSLSIAARACKLGGLQWSLHGGPRRGGKTVVLAHTGTLRVGVPSGPREAQPVLIIGESGAQRWCNLMPCGLQSRACVLAEPGGDPG